MRYYYVLVKSIDFFSLNVIFIIGYEELDELF